MHNPIVPALIAAGLQYAASLPTVATAYAQTGAAPPADHLFLLADTVTATGKVEMIDRTLRRVSLRGEDGRVLVVKVAPTVSDFNQIAAGDRLNVEVIESIAVSIAAEPASGAAEATAPDVQRAATVAPREKPAGVDVGTVQMTAVIDEIDHVGRRAKLKGSEGTLLAVHIDERIGNIERFHKGDTVVIRHTEAVAISVSK